MRKTKKKRTTKPIKQNNKKLSRMNASYIDERVLTPKERALDIYDNMHESICTSNGLSESDSTAKSASQCTVLAVYNIISAIKQFHTGPEWLLEESMAWSYWHMVADEAILINK